MCVLFPHEGANLKLFHTIKKGMLPSGSKDLARICSTVTTYHYRVRNGGAGGGTREVGNKE